MKHPKILLLSLFILVASSGFGQKMIHELPRKTNVPDSTWLMMIGNPTAGTLYKMSVDNFRDSVLSIATLGGGTTIDTTSLSNRINLKANIASPTFTGTVSGITASMVGLGNVTNTSDANKPVSTAQQTALDLKANLSGPTFTGTVVLPSTTSIGTISNTELGYVDGVTSAIQTQFNAIVSSQWVTAGSDIYFSAGTAGIGTSTEYSNNSHDALLSVAGTVYGKSQYEHVLENTRTSGVGADATQYNVLAIKTNHNSTAAGIRFLDISGNEAGAVGYGNPGTLVGYLDDAMYISSSNLYNASGTPTRNEPTRIVIGQEGQVSGVQQNVRRMVFDFDWTISIFNNTGGTAFNISPNGSINFGSSASPNYNYDPSSSANALRSIAKEQTIQGWKDAAAAKVWSLGSNTIGGGPGNDFVLNMYNGSAWSERLRLKDNGVFNLSANARQVFANDAAAGSGGLVTGDIYQTSAGVLMIKQ